MDYPSQDFIELGADDYVQLPNKNMDDMEHMDNAFEDLGKIAVFIAILSCILGLLLGVGLYIYAA